MDQFGIFAKYWEPGRVKTRLAASLGPEVAAGIYQTFVATLLERYSSLRAKQVIVYAPAERRNEFSTLVGESWQLQPQADGDLGARMHEYFSSAFAAGSERVVLIGSDSPTLPVEFIEQAFERLTESSVVLGPTEDGGYYLIGASGHVPPVFHDITWSSDQVWQQTIDRLKATRTSYQALSEWYDVDDEEDLHRLLAELSTSGDRDPVLQRLRARLTVALSNQA